VNWNIQFFFPHISTITAIERLNKLDITPMSLILYLELAVVSVVLRNENNRGREQKRFSFRSLDPLVTKALSPSLYLVFIAFTAIKVFALADILCELLNFIAPRIYDHHFPFFFYISWRYLRNYDRVVTYKA